MDGARTGYRSSEVEHTGAVGEVVAEEVVTIMEAVAWPVTMEVVVPVDQAVMKTEYTAICTQLLREGKTPAIIIRSSAVRAVVSTASDSTTCILLHCQARHL